MDILTSGARQSIEKDREMPKKHKTSDEALVEYPFNYPLNPRKVSTI